MENRDRERELQAELDRLTAVLDQLPEKVMALDVHKRKRGYTIGFRAARKQIAALIAAEVAKVRIT